MSSAVMALLECEQGGDAFAIYGGFLGDRGVSWRNDAGRARPTISSAVFFLLGARGSSRVYPGSQVPPPPPPPPRSFPITTPPFDALFLRPEVRSAKHGFAPTRAVPRSARPHLTLAGIFIAKPPRKGAIRRGERDNLLGFSARRKLHQLSMKPAEHSRKFPAHAIFSSTRMISSTCQRPSLTGPPNGARKVRGSFPSSSRPSRTAATRRLGGSAARCSPIRDPRFPCLPTRGFRKCGEFLAGGFRVLRCGPDLGKPLASATPSARRGGSPSHDFQSARSPRCRRWPAHTGAGACRRKTFLRGYARNGSERPPRPRSTRP